MSKQKVYISSTYNDLKDFRALLIDFFDKEGSNHFEKLRIMEHMYADGSDKPFLKTCIEEVEKCDLYIIILGQNAGSFPPAPDDGLTYTQHEYQTAITKKKKIFRFAFNGFDKDKCDNLESYNNLKDQFIGRDVLTFDDREDFEIKYLKAFFVLTDKYTATQALNLNRSNELSRFQAEAVKLNPNSCSLFVYNATSQDKPNYYNYRLRELFKFRTNVKPKDFFIDMNFFVVPNTVDQILYQFVLKCLKVLNIDDTFNNQLTNVTQIKEEFYALLKDMKVEDLVIPIKITKLELDPEYVIAFSANVISLLRNFDFDNTKKWETRLHFVICFEVDELNDTIGLYQDLKKEFKICGHVTLNKIGDYDIDRWVEYSDLDAIAQLGFKDEFLKNLKKYSFELPAKMASIEVPFDETIKHFNS